MVKSLILYYSIELNVTISADYNPAPGEVPEELGPNEFTAGSELTLNCIVHGESGALTYEWSVMGNPDTTDCTNCVVIDTSSPPSTSSLTLGKPALNSYFAGTYTCTVTESGRPDSSGMNDFTVTVVGKINDNHLYFVHYTFIDNLCIIIIGAGLYARTPSSDFDPGPIANNSIIVSGSDGLRLFCVSNSSRSGVGTITASNGETLNIGNNGIWNLANVGTRPGFLRLQTRQLLTASDQGIYTCNIPVDNENYFIFNVGLYPSDFNGKY